MMTRLRSIRMRLEIVRPPDEVAREQPMSFAVRKLS
jgi:hypothetical protein